MKLLLAVLSIATVGAPAAGLKLKDIQDPNLSVEYWLQLMGNAELKRGSFLLNSCTEYVSSSPDSLSITILCRRSILLNAIGIRGKAEQDAVAIVRAAVTSLVPDIKIKECILLARNTHLLGLPDTLDPEVGIQVKVGLRLKVFSFDKTCAELVDGTVVLLDGKKYVKITETNLNWYAEFFIITAQLTVPTKLEEGPYWGLPIQLEKE